MICSALARSRFEIAQKPQFFQQVAVEMLGLIDQQHEAFAGLMILQDQIGHAQTQFLLARPIVGQRQLVEDRLKERPQRSRKWLFVRKALTTSLPSRSSNRWHNSVLPVPGAHGDEHRPFIILEAPEQSFQDALMTGGGVIMLTVRRGREWTMLQAKSASRTW